MAVLKVSEDLRPLSDLKARAGDVVRQAGETGRPIVLTRHGRGVAVVLSIEAFEELQHDAQRAVVQRAVENAERDLVAGHEVADEQVEAKLRRWAGGGA